MHSLLNRKSENMSRIFRLLQCGVTVRYGARLKVCDEVMNNMARLGDGEVLDPSDQWGNQPGGLP